MHRFLTEMSLEQLGALYGALPEQMAQALAVPIATALKSRPQTIARRPEAMRVKGLRAYLRSKRDDDLASEILRTYFLGPRVELVKTFLDKTGVQHEDGQVEDDDAEPEADKVAAAVDALSSEFDASDVLLYLRVAAVQWPENAGVTQALDKLASPA